MTTQVKFFRDEVAKLLQAPTGEVGKFMSKLGDRALDEARERVGVDTGKLKGSLKKKMGRVGREIYAEIGSDLDYAIHHHQGGKPHVIFPRRARVLVFQSGGQTVFARRVNHPGSRGNPFLVEAVRAVFRKL